MMIVSFGRGALAVALTFHIQSGCAPSPPAPAHPVATIAANPVAARAAGLHALDRLAPVWGEVAGAGPCAARYDAAPLRVRCAALMADPGALAPELATLDRLAAAWRDDATAAAGLQWLAAMDVVFAAVEGRRAPVEPAAETVFAAAEERTTAMLTRDGPGYGAAALNAVMERSGRPLNVTETRRLFSLVVEAERALSAWDAAEAETREVAAALDEYRALTGALGANSEDIS